MSQEQFFLKGEGNQWFRRNRQVLVADSRLERDPAFRMMRKLRPAPRRILEVGCSNGWRLNALAHLYRSATLVGVDPSRSALEDGRKHYAGVKFRRGVASRLPLGPQEAFDRVIVHFVLHWVSRKELLRSIAEIDRAVEEGGYLILSDFLPDGPTRVRYHHAPKDKIYTYKLDYAAIFLSTGNYIKVRERVFHHESLRAEASIPSHQRATCVVLRKTADRYQERKLPWIPSHKKKG